MNERGEKLDVRVTGYLKERLISLAYRERLSMSDLAAALLCQALDIDPAQGVVRKRVPGPRPTVRHSEDRRADA